MVFIMKGTSPQLGRQRHEAPLCGAFLMARPFGASSRLYGLNQQNNKSKPYVAVQQRCTLFP